ncbi:hypothetical protein D0Z07_4615 [Hyphodiscus hymeniophilus]|uniref:Uncharacterized protein n=1 Tax=Hyphodiscus hymeniophilus TaxID=353542 RepID=A0A9P6VJN7_9HELO|nr:hypothetical protein D0Z07_4615 [Hyphodiscus hymeniophilus]
MSHRPKQPLDVLQSMINGILIEVGRALRATDKEGGTVTNPNTRLRSFFPGAIDNFHQALDDLESDIVRAKAVFLRDLEDLQTRRHALETPPAEPILNATADDPISAEDMQQTIMMENNEPTSEPTIKEEEVVPQDTAPEEAENTEAITTDPLKNTSPEDSDSPKGLQGPSPPSSANDTNKINSVGLGIDSPATEDPALAQPGIPDSSIDELFDMTDSGNNDGLALNFDTTDFLESSNTQGQNDFDLSTFGNTEDFNLDVQASNDAGDTNSSNKQDDLFGLGNSGEGGDLMDLDLDLGAVGGDSSTFDDLFNFGADGGEMEHGEIDSAFFGID